jgi:hypothetical protein
MRIATLCVVGLMTVQQVVAEQPKDELAPPVHVLVDGKPLDTGGKGHAAPFFADFDGDSVKDLLIGEMADGQLRIYRNTGTNRQPKFDGFLWFHGGSETGRVPAG